MTIAEQLEARGEAQGKAEGKTEALKGKCSPDE